MNIAHVLRGTEAGEIQTVGKMQVIPLVLKDASLNDLRFGVPSDAAVGTEDYGVLTFINETEKPVIIPTNAAYLVKMAAQNHAMTRTGFISPKSGKRYGDACCIEQRQPGTIPVGKYELKLLPYSLRETAMAMKNNPGFDKLWTPLQHYNRKFQLPSDGDLGIFYNAFAEQLDQFVAEFELIPNQVGAIILIDGYVVGVERAPSMQFWKEVWTPIIRECYGSLALELVILQGGKAKPPKTRVALKTRSLKSLDNLLEALEQADIEEHDRVKDVVGNLLDAEFDEKVDETSGGFAVRSWLNDQFFGQVVTEGRTQQAKVVYASLITRHQWNKHRSWYEAKPFSM